MTIQEFYTSIEGNYEEALGRLMKPDFVKRFASKFAKDGSFNELTTNLDADNTETAFRAAHTLKGVCKNLAFTKLANSSSEITEMLRAGNIAAAKEYFPTVKADYDKVIAAIGLIE